MPSIEASTDLSCPLLSVDNGGYGSKLADPEGTVLHYIRLTYEGENLDRADTMGYDPDLGQEVVSSGATAARDCAALIVAGECSRYNLTDEGQVVERSPQAV